MVDFVSVKKAAEECGVSDNLLRNLIKAGKCPGVYSGTRFYVNMGELKKYLKKATSGS